jgi:hypothetical protein
VTSQDPQLVASGLKVQPLEEEVAVSLGPTVLALPTADSPGTPWSRRQEQLQQGKVPPQSLSEGVTISFKGDVAVAESEAPTRC